MSTITPINRYTEQVIEDDGTKAYKVYNKISPHYYVDATGSLNPIDITNVQTITKDTVGVIKLREKNVVSVGFRTDGNKTKYLGMRPDDTQEDGTQQLEWTIEEAIINNVTQSITLNQTSSINNITTNLGGQVVQSTRNYTRQMVPVTGSISNFQVKYKLHLTGLQISNSKDTGTNYYTSDNGYFKITDTDNNTKFQISLPVLLDSNFEQVTNDTRHTLKDNGDNTYEYIKYPSDNLLSTGITGSVSYVDATTIYGGTDGVVRHNYVFGPAQSWDTVHDAAGGSSAIGNQASTQIAVGVRGDFPNSNYHQIHRSFFTFDTSGISAIPDSTTLNIMTDSYTDSDLIAIEATHTEIATSTYNDFTGFESGWDGDAGDTSVVPYSDEFSDVADDEEYSSIPLISAGLSAIASNDTTKICVMDYDYDYKDVDPGTTYVVTGLYYSTAGGTTADPYLYVIAKILPPLTTFKVLSGKLTMIGGSKVIIK